jgi:DNA polymerase III epsilon subunit-like protein
MITKLTGVTTKDLQSKGVTFQRAMDHFLSFLRRCKITMLVGYNHTFDWRFLIKSCIREDYRKLPEMRTLDVMEISKSHFTGSARPASFKLVDVYHHVFHESFRAHQATDDALATLRLALYFSRMALVRRSFESCVLVRTICAKVLQSSNSRVAADYSCTKCHKRVSRFFSHLCIK